MVSATPEHRTQILLKGSWTVTTETKGRYRQYPYCRGNAGSWRSTGCPRGPWPHCKFWETWTRLPSSLGNRSVKLMWRTWPGFPFPEALGESAQRKDKVLTFHAKGEINQHFSENSTQPLLFHKDCAL